MSIETPDRINYDEWLKDFKGHKPETPDGSPPLPKIDLGVDAVNLSGVLNTAATNLAKDPAVSGELIDEHDSRFRSNKMELLALEPVTGNRPLTFALTRVTTFFKDGYPQGDTYPVYELGKSRTIYNFRLHQWDSTAGKTDSRFRDQAPKVCTFTITQKSADCWELEDRFVSHLFREQGLAKAFLESIYAFMQQRAETTGTPQELVINTGQPAVLFYYSNRGFDPRNPNDEARAERIKNGGPRLDLDYARERGYDENGQPDGRYLIENEKDPYIYDRDVTERNELNALRVEIKRDFKPKTTPADRITTDVIGAIEKI